MFPLLKRLLKRLEDPPVQMEKTHIDGAEIGKVFADGSDQPSVVDPDLGRVAEI